MARFVSKTLLGLKDYHYNLIFEDLWLLKREPSGFHGMVSTSSMHGSAKNDIRCLLANVGKVSFKSPSWKPEKGNKIPQPTSPP